MSIGTPTFERLQAEKKERFIEAFFKEFTLHKYDEASISRVLKELKIAKGSFYQYFSDKNALYFYLIQLCGEKKQAYQNQIHRSNYVNFWEYWNELYQIGYAFDRAYPVMSNFMLKLYNSSNSPTLIHHFEARQQQSLNAISALIKTEQEVGLFRLDIDSTVMAQHLLVVNQGLLDQLQLEFKVEFHTRMTNGEPLFSGAIGARYEDLKNDTLLLLSAAFNKI